MALLMEFSPSVPRALGLIGNATQKWNSYTVFSVFLTYCLHFSEAYLHPLLVYIPRVPLCTHQFKTPLGQF